MKRRHNLEEIYLDGTTVFIWIVMLWDRIWPADIDRKQRLMTGTVNSVMHILIAQKTRNFFPFCTVSHTVSQTVEELRYRTECCGSVRHDVTGNLQWYNISGRTKTHCSTQNFTVRSTGNIFVGGKSHWFLGLLNNLHSFADNFEICETQILEHSDIVQSCTGTDLHLSLHCIVYTSYS
jgi:hypothetical protein